MDTLRHKIDATRRQDSRDVATAEAASDKLAERQRREKMHRANRAAWAEFEMRQAEVHRQLSEEHEARALALLGEAS